ncbi:LLM class flavin-dependent oxidoreductase [Streptomyces aidingensis]|uniref:Luciferase-like monooxygenase n=1 Tax=Streptomyces aidingensis TaxID=910347 RepID=A0A1I1NNX3_9ACTN|nr:LLM class flavin-dependent oxidoreductase [Streptomyces aidingensis]SFC99394.1 Luciferase-like monooxygenase [Streptomyces aidingensis]
MDYGREVEFGVFPEPSAEKLPEALSMAQIADREGLELVGIQDHPYQRRHLDTWALMGAVLAGTQRVRVFPDVANLPLRAPAVMAKTAASLDLLSGGRFELGLGAGSFWEAVAAMGGSRRSPGEAYGALREAVEVLRLMWSDERSVRYEGKHYRLAGVKPGPRPAHPIPVWLGVGGPRTLALCGRVADGWLPSSPWAPPEKLPELNARIDEAAAGAGREPGAVRRLYNVFGIITDGPSEGFLRGPAEQWVAELTELALVHGMDGFVFGPADDPVRQTHRFAAEVVPAVRRAVAQERIRRTTR